MTSGPDRDQARDLRALRREADHVALDDHSSTSARPVHRIIATHLWTMLRDLGFADGRVLAVGDGAATLLGLPHNDDTSPLSVVADVPAAHAPSSQLSTQVRAPKAHERFDVVISSLPYNDVRLQDPEHVIARRAVQTQVAMTMQRLTRPGGYTMLLASHDLLDHPFPETRRHLHLGADLVGAVRLPAGSLRQLPGLDLPTDLLVLQRRPDGVSTRSQDFEHTVTIHVDNRDVEINTYFENNADHVLGTVGADPLAWGPAAVTVSNTPDRLEPDLAEALGNVTAHALRTGLTYTPGPTRPALPDPSVAELIRRHHRREGPHAVTAAPAPRRRPRSRALT